MMALAGVSSLPAMAAAADSAKETTYFRVTGFSCPTCSVGLDTMMERKAGVVWSKSSYEQATAVICFHPSVISEQALRDAIAEMGFHAEKRS